MASPSFWRDRRVLVTGATGLLGSWLCRQLVREQAEVVVLVRDRVPASPGAAEVVNKSYAVVSGSVEDFPLVARTINEYEIETVFHLAAQAVVGTALRDPLSTFASNIQGTWTVLEACRRVGTVSRVLVASSDKAYGDQPSLPYREDSPLLGRAPYDVSKACADLLAQAYAATYDLPVVITRCGNLFGGGDLNWNRIIPGTIRAAIRGVPPVIRSNGKLVRDYFYVRDAVEAYLLLAPQTHRSEIRGRAYNFSEELPLTTLEVCQMTLAAAGRPDLVPIIEDSVRHEILDQRLDSKRARTELGWRPRFGLEVGLEETVRWYHEYFSQGREFSPLESPWPGEGGRQGSQVRRQDKPVAQPKAGARRASGKLRLRPARGSEAIFVE